MLNKSAEQREGKVSLPVKCETAVNSLQSFNETEAEQKLANDHYWTAEEIDKGYAAWLYAEASDALNLEREVRSLRAAWGAR